MITNHKKLCRCFAKALEEIIEIGRVTGMPVQISHFRLAMKRLWGKSHKVCTDGGLVELHPRVRGSYPRILGRYARELQALSTGITQVWVNGVSVFSNGATSGNLPGVFIRRAQL